MTQFCGTYDKYFSYIVVVSKTTDLPQVTNKLYHIMLDEYTSPSAGIELITLLANPI
jgi:hypothetical protein